MKRLCGILCALLFAVAAGSGCQSPDGSSPFDEAVKDWRGDNMQMRGFGDQSASMKRGN